MGDVFDTRVHIAFWVILSTIFFNFVEEEEKNLGVGMCLKRQIFDAFLTKSICSTFVAKIHLERKREGKWTGEATFAFLWRQREEIKQLIFRQTRQTAPLISPSLAKKIIKCYTKFVSLTK